MNKPILRRFGLLIAASLLTIAGAATADDVEIFQGMPNTVSSVRPNILFIFDTSGSMTTKVVTQVNYDPAVSFTPAVCSTGNYYFLEQGKLLPDNASDICGKNAFPVSTFKCNAAMAELNSFGSFLAKGARQWNAKDKWNDVRATTKTDRYIECKSDAGIHGDGVDTTKLYAANGKSPTGPWNSNAAQQVDWSSAKSYTFYTANYLNWYYGGKTVESTRIKIMQDVAKSTLSRLATADNVNVGLMRFDRNAEGGMVLREVKPVAEVAAAMSTDIDGLTAAGNTPLSETMYEAYLYLSGSKLKFGDNTSPVHSVSSSRTTADPSVYKSPLLTSCQKSFIVLLTDGEPTSDNSADTAIEALRDEKCNDNGKAGRCLEEMAEYMYENDMRSQLADLQNVVTYTIGFGDDVAGSKALKETARKGGGQFFVAGDTATLTNVLTTIVRAILAYNTTFTAPAVSVNAFNRTQNLNDLYITAFKPTESFAWFGNVKKYRLTADGTIVDANGSPAVNPGTGFFRDTAQSFWSAAVDGDVARRGGAASRLPAPASRKLYSNLDPVDPGTLTAAANQVSVANMLITTTTLGLAVAEPPGRDALIDWVRGADIDDDNGDNSTTDARLTMGDPMHGRPATVVYGGTAASPDPNDSVVYAVTNEGFLHAIDTKNGDELWAFAPKQQLVNSSARYRNQAVTSRVYGLDGNIRVNQIDLNSNGVVEPLLGDKVLIYFGMRRGGSDYFALDVTNRNAPKFLWRIGPNETGSKQLTGAGQSWSTPTLTRVDISGAAYHADNTKKQVLIFGGGYDTVQDNGPYAEDTVGSQIFMVDAFSGNRLWYAARDTDLLADLKLKSMKHSIPADIRVLDLTGDGFADRMYAGDMGSRVWRFDIENGQPKGSLVTGGVFAELGDKKDENTRRFYNAPDVAYLNYGGRTWLNIAIGSGYRGHPLSLQTQERFYALRDHMPLLRLTQTQYNDLEPITEDDTGLIDVTDDIAPTIPAGSKGWRLDLRRASGAWSGEKSLTEARTFQGIVQFTTYEPNALSTEDSDSCAPAIGTNRLYSVNAGTGAPVFNRDNPADPPDSTEDRDGELAQGGIAPEVVWVFPPPDDPVGCVGAECRPPPVCLVGLESCGIGVELSPVRTFWRQTGVN